MGNVLATAGSAVHGAPSHGTTYLFALLLAAMILALALEEKLHAKKSLITGIFALVTLLLGAAFRILPFGSVVNVFGERVHLPVYVPGVDWGVVAIIFGASLFVDVTGRSGLFSWIAIRLTKASRGDPLLLLILYGVMTVAFSAVLNNVTAMLVVGSLTAVSLDKLGDRDKLLGFLLVEGLLTNVGGLLTLISSVPNIIVGHAAKIGFAHFFVVAGPYVAVATLATVLLGARVFSVKRLDSDAARRRAVRLVSTFDEKDGIESRGFFAFCAVLFALFIGVLATTSVIPYVRDLEMGYVALAFAAVALLKYKSSADRFYKALDWDLLLFFTSLFVVINVMEHAGVLRLIGSVLGRVVGLGSTWGTGALLASSAGASAVTDNIPLSAVLAKILASQPDPPAPGLWWAVVFGANLGGNLTPIGSASTVVAVTIMHKHTLGMTFGRFVRLAAPFAALQIVLAIAYVVLFVS